jgi:RNA polymerase sigma-70 factor (ECF subfamily)
MDEAAQLLEAFTSGLPPAGRDRLDGAALAPFLSARWAAARAAWPAIMVPPALFGGFLAARLAPESASVTALESLAVEELYLTCACASGNGEALRLLEKRYFPKARAALVVMRLGRDVVDEVLQRLRTDLLVDPGDGQPRIVQFRGRGTLGSWLSVSAVRIAYKLVQRETREQTDEDERLASVTSRDIDPESALTQGRYRDAFRAAFSAALLSLDDRDKNLLRQHYLDGLPIDRLSKLYRTHRTTAARWLAMAKQRLLDRTRSHLMTQLHVPLPDCDSIIRMVKSQFDLTMHRLFTTVAPAR